MKTSICSFIRSQLKVKGSTKHDSYYKLECDLPWFDFRKQVKKQVRKWIKKGLVEEINQLTYDGVSIKFKSQVTTTGNNRTLFISRSQYKSFKSISIW